MSPKIITTIIEDEVVFLTNVDAEFVSFVTHGANRTPFKILKSESEGGNTMDKVVQSVLIPKGLSDEQVTKCLEGFRTDEAKKFDSYTTYEQVSLEDIEADSMEAVWLDEDTKVMGVIGALKKDVKKDDDVPTVEKEALDYATMDALYDELYAMADIVSGSMRQSNIKPGVRKNTILTAIENFKSYAEMLLKSLKEENILPLSQEKLEALAALETVDVVCPDCNFETSIPGLLIGKLVHKDCTKPLEKKSEKDTKNDDLQEFICPKCKIVATSTKAMKCGDCDKLMVLKSEFKEDDSDSKNDPAPFDAEALGKKIQDGILEQVTTVMVDSLKETKGAITSIGEQIGGLRSEIDLQKSAIEKTDKSDAIKDLGEKLESGITELKGKIAAVSKEVDKIKVTPKGEKSNKDDNDDLDPDKKKKTFKGSIFKPRDTE